MTKCKYKKTPVEKGGISFTKGYKYQLARDLLFKTCLRPESPIITDFYELDIDGELRVKKGYAWDGASGPTYDDKTNYRSSCLHDVLYQMMRNKEIALLWRKYADDMLHDVSRKDGMSKFRAWYWLKGVRKFAASAADPKNKKKVVTV